MSERRSHEVEGGQGPLEPTCDTWVTTDADEPVIGALLLAAGVDLEHDPIDVALAGARPPRIGAAVLSALSEDEQELYAHEDWVLSRRLSR